MGASSYGYRVGSEATPVKSLRKISSPRAADVANTRTTRVALEGQAAAQAGAGFLAAASLLPSERAECSVPPTRCRRIVV